MPSKVSVVLLTCDRPGYLEDALRGISCQSALQSVEAVIISEGGSTDTSRQVSAGFPTLPIVYHDHRGLLIWQKERLEPIWNSVRTPLVAFLHDDDWWSSEHLEEALDVLDGDADCAGVFGNYYVTEGPEYPYWLPLALAQRVWLASDRDFRHPVKLLDDVGITLACLLDSTFHYSSLVGRTQAIRDSNAQVVTTENLYDNDRYYPIVLSSYGRIGYIVRPNVFIRQHAMQDSQRPEFFAKTWERKCDTTRWLLKKEPRRVAQAAARFNKAMEQVPAECVSQLWDSIGEPQRTTLIEECGLRAASPAPAEAAPPRNRDIKWWIRQVCPPGLLALGRRLQGITGSW
jgi:hypothetical protein